MKIDMSLDTLIREGKIRRAKQSKLRVNSDSDHTIFSDEEENAENNKVESDSDADPKKGKQYENEISKGLAQTNLQS